MKPHTSPCTAKNQGRIKDGGRGALRASARGPADFLGPRSFLGPHVLQDRTAHFFGGTYGAPRFNRNRLFRLTA